MLSVLFILVSFMILTGCQSFNSRTPAMALIEDSCSQLIHGLLTGENPNLLKRMDTHALNIEPAFFASFAAYIRDQGTGPELVVRRLSDGKEIHTGKLKSTDIERVHFNDKKGRLELIGPRAKVTRYRGFALKPVHRTPVSYQEVLAQMERDPYPNGEIPNIPIQMFRFFKERLVDFFVARRSSEILRAGADYRVQGMKKPIHPMGVGVTGKAIFFPSKYSGAFNGGEFPLLGRLSISQGNPSKYKARSWLRQKLGLPAKEEVRSVAAAFKIFPTQDLDAKVVTANAVFQNDLNGEELKHYLDGVMTNQPQLNVLKIRKSYEIFTLLGVAKGALSNPNDLKAKFPYMNPQLRPLHQFAQMGVAHSGDVVTPKWMKIQTDSAQEVIPSDDFRIELQETIEQKGLVYRIFLADQVDENGEIIWEEAGRIELERSILSRGVDENLLFHHDGLRSPLTGEIIDADVVPVPVRSPEVLD